MRHRPVPHAYQKEDVHKDVEVEGRENDAGVRVVPKEDLHRDDEGSVE